MYYKIILFIQRNISLEYRYHAEREVHGKGTLLRRI